MLHRTVQTFQRAALRQSSARQHGHAHGFRFQPSHLHTKTRSLHDDSDDLPFSQASSQTPSHRSWTVDKIASLQSDTDTTKVRLDNLKTSVDTQISCLQTNLKADLTTQISALRSMVESKFDKVDSKVESKFDKVESKIDTFQNEMRHNLSELRAELDKKILGHSMESKQHEIRLIWLVIFSTMGITAIAVGSAVTMFMRDRVPLQKIPHVEQAPL